MPIGKPLPFISQKSVRQALDILVYSSSKPDTPLLFLLLVDEFLLNPALPTMANSREYALAHILGYAITLEFTRQRQIFDIAIPELNDSRESTLTLIKEDAKVASPEIVGWSWLYHHFVRVDLSVSPQEFCDIAHIDERTLRRYQSHSSKRLTDLLVDAEWKTRTLQRKRRLYSELPVSTTFPIMGREALTEDLVQTLTELRSAHFQISGGKGVGKTTFVERVLRTQIDSEDVEQLIWIDRPSSCNFVRHRLLERLIPIQSQIGLREYFQIYRTIIVLDDAEMLYEDTEGLLELLKLLAVATVFIICNFHAPLINTIQVALAELDRANARNLIRYFFKTMKGYGEVDEDTIQLIQKHVGGNPLALQLTVLNWSRMNIQGLTSNIGLDAIFNYLFESIELDLKRAWVAFAILSPGIFDYAELHKMWPQCITAQTIDQLLGRHLLQISLNSKHSYALVDSARNYVRERYGSDLRVRGMVEELIEDLDAADVTDVMHIENILMNDWIIIESGKRKRWVDNWWRIGLSSHHWSNWCVLLEAEARADAPDIDMAIGYAACLRHLGEAEAARNYLYRLMEDTGRKGAFGDQAIAMAELAIVERQIGAYESASSLLASVERVSVRLKLDFLYENIALEQAQIAVDVRDVENFADLMVKMPHNPRADLLRSEMFLLWNDIESSRQVAETILSLPELELTTKAHVHDILGRMYEQLSDLQKAEEHFSWCLMIVEKNDDSFSIARAQSNLGSILLRLKHFEEAQILLTNAENQQLLLNDRVGLATTRHNLRQLEIEIATS